MESFLFEADRGGFDCVLKGFWYIGGGVAAGRKVFPVKMEEILNEIYFLHSHEGKDMEDWVPAPLVVPSPKGPAVLSFALPDQAEMYLKLSGVDEGWSSISEKDLLKGNPVLKDKVKRRLHLPDEEAVKLLKKEDDEFPYEQYLTKAVWSKP